MEQTGDEGEVQVTDLTVGLQAGVKQYLRQGRTVLPFVQVGGFLHFTGTRHDGPTSTTRLSEGEEERERVTSLLEEDLRGWSTETGAELGAGLDWFPAESVSVGGHAGIRYGRTHGERNESFDESVKSAPLSSSRSTTSTTGSDGYILRLFITGLKVQLYF